MKTLLINVLTIIVLFLLPNVNFGQIAPDLGTSSNFALFTAAGAFANTGTSTVTGDIGTKVGAFDATGITLDGNIYLPGSGVANAAGDDVLAAYAEMSTMGGSVLGVGLGNGQMANRGPIRFRSQFCFRGYCNCWWSYPFSVNLIYSGQGPCNSGRNYPG
jgi:hypothetical protein